MAQDERAAWIARVLGFTVPTRGVTNTDALQSRLARSVPLLKSLKAAGAPEMPALLAALEAANGGLNGANAADLLDTLEAMIAHAQAAASGHQAVTAEGGGISYPKLLQRWSGAQAQARQAVAQIGRAVLAMPEVQSDPRFPRVEVAVAMLPGLIPDLGGQLADLLNRGANNDSDAGDAVAAVAAYRQRLSEADALRSLENFARKHVGEVAVYTALDGALAEIGESLDAAA
jgi:DNA-binding phage protein